MVAEFVHLHLHTQYSMLDGALRIKPELDKVPEERNDVAHRVARMGMSAVAITDHANMFGALTFYKACLESGIRPIVGCELNLARATGARGRAAESAPVDHLVALAASERGYRNLIKLVSLGHMQPASDVAPSVSLETVADLAQDLVLLTGCLGGVIPQAVLIEGQEAAAALLGRLKQVVEPEHLFVELQDHGLAEQPIVNQLLVELARKVGLPLVATNDVHYPERDDADAQLMLSCIQANCTYDEAKASHHGSMEMYLKSPAEMAHRFRGVPEAITSTLKIAEMCSGWRLALGEPMLPSFPLPEGQDTAGYFAHVAREGLKKRFEEARSAGRQLDAAAYEARLEHEIATITEMKFPGYFLIVWDFIQFAKREGIPVGPGRGSGAGSLVAYSMRITDLDPMPYDLLFERFLNPERISMPDFDIDFCMDRRDEVFRYVKGRFGEQSVGHIATFHELKARSVIKDVARAKKMLPADAQKIANLIPALGQGKIATIAEALALEPKLRAIKEQNDVQAQVIEQAQKLEGLTRHVGMHAAGVVMADGPLWNHVPCFKHDNMMVTQYHMSDVEQAGLVKFDFLGLRTLTVIQVAVRLINERPDRPPEARRFDINTIPLDDAATFALLQSGETTGVFQLESTGMQGLFKKLRPDRFEDIVAAVALYRPGPLRSGMVDNFVACKHGRQPIARMHPLIDDILRPTYGVIVYQEQVMQIARKLAGYTLGGADLLRRAMGKKKKEEMDRQRDAFVEGAVGNGVDKRKAIEIFELVAQFAEYGFNKSHSAGYGLICYQTAHLKAHFPAEFLCALMTADRERTEKVVRFIAEGRSMGVCILPPDINDSDTGFKVVYGSPDGSWRAPRGARFTDPLQPQIRFGLGAVRGVGDAALETIFEARRHGPFRDLFDFCGRVDARKLNRGVLEALVQCGAFDKALEPLGVSRACAFQAVDRALERGRSASKDRERGQTTLFGAFDAGEAAANTDLSDYPSAPPWDLRETCVREKQALGFYVSGHPLDRYGKELERFALTPVRDLGDLDNWAKVRTAGMVEGYHEKIFKGSNGKTAFFEIEDKTGRVTVRVRDALIDVFSGLLTSGESVVVCGTLRFAERQEDGADEGDAGTREPTILLEKADLLSSMLQAEARGVVFRLSASRVRPEQLAELGKLLHEVSGTCAVSIVLEMPGGAEVHLSLGPDLRVQIGDRLFAGLERLFGNQQVVELR